MKNNVLAAATASLIVLLGAAPARAAERSEVAEQYRWDLSALYADEAAWVAAGQSIGKQLPSLGPLAGQARGVAGDAARRARRVGGRVPRGRSLFRLCDAAERPGHARGAAAADAAAGHPGLHRAADRHRVHAPGDPGGGPPDDRALPGRGAAPRPVPHVPRRHPARGAAHAVARGGKDRRAGGRHGADRPAGAQRLHQRRHAVPRGDALDRREGAAGCVRVHEIPRLAGQGRP